MSEKYHFPISYGPIYRIDGLLQERRNYIANAPE